MSATLSPEESGIIWVGEYSPSQDAFHCQPLVEAVRANLRRLLRRDLSNDWVPVAIGNQEVVTAVLGILHRLKEFDRMLEPGLMTLAEVMAEGKEGREFYKILCDPPEIKMKPLSKEKIETGRKAIQKLTESFKQRSSPLA